MQRKGDRVNQTRKLESLILKRDGLQEQIAAIVTEERAALQQQIRALDRLTVRGNSGKNKRVTRMSDAARARQSRAAKKRWREAKQAGKNRL
jgi:hypothetical protein